MVDPISIASTIINVAKMIKKVIDDKLEADSLCKEVRATSLPKTAGVVRVRMPSWPEHGYCLPCPCTRVYR
jgi:hypothetical protein